MTTYTYAGVSRAKNGFKVRFANDSLRVKVLIAAGIRDIDLIQLKAPMEKLEAVKYLLSIDFANGNAEVQAALDAALEKREPKTPKVKAVKTPKVKAVKTPKAKPAKAPKAKPTLDTIKAKAKVKIKPLPAVDEVAPVAGVSEEDTPY